MNRPRSLLLASVASLGLSATAGAAPGRSAHSSSREVTGHEAVASVRHDWKPQAHRTLRAERSGGGPVPAGFGRLSPEARLAYLHARRDLAPARFDHFHPALGPRLALDDRLRLAQSQDCRPMNGLLPDTARTNYLHHRRSLDPARFDTYHPSLGAILAEDDILKSGRRCPRPEVIPPPVAVTPAPGSQSIVPPGTPSVAPPVGGGPPAVRSVPEPGSLTLIALGCAGAMTPRLIRRLRRRPDAP
jgi:hypothetical protein